MALESGFLLVDTDRLTFDLGLTAPPAFSFFSDDLGLYAGDAPCCLVRPRPAGVFPDEPLTPVLEAAGLGFSLSVPEPPKKASFTFLLC